MHGAERLYSQKSRRSYVSSGLCPRSALNSPSWVLDYEPALFASSFLYGAHEHLALQDDEIVVLMQMPADGFYLVSIIYDLSFFIFLVGG